MWAEFSVIYLRQSEFANWNHFAKHVFGTKSFKKCGVFLNKLYVLDGFKGHEIWLHRIPVQELLINLMI